jgi:hypothetical protein
MLAWAAGRVARWRPAAREHVAPNRPAQATGRTRLRSRVARVRAGNPPDRRGIRPALVARHGPSMRSAPAANAVRQRSGRDPSSRAEASRSGSYQSIHDYALLPVILWDIGSCRSNLTLGALVCSGDDFVWVCGPCERLGIMVCLRAKTIDGGLEIDHASEDTAV